MADKTMHHVVIGADNFEIVDETARKANIVIDQDDSDQEYAVTFRVEGHHLVSTLTPAS